VRPESLLDLSNELSSLPGITKKQSEKIAFYLIKSDPSISKRIADAMGNASLKIKQCSICNHITEKDVCDICLDTTRKKLLVIVQDSTDIFKFEDAGNINPHYHVLGGLINVSKNIELSDLNIDNLTQRAKEYNEIILALSPNLEGIVTANFLKELLNESKVTQLAQGIPLGAAMEYVDELTLKAAIENRKDVK